MRPGPVADRFEILSHAGSGGMATVYRARDHETGAVVALKLLGSISERERFVREAEMLANLDHPNIVRYVAHGESSDGAFLAMEWLEGESLAARLRRESLAVDDALALTSRIAGALGYAHGLGIVHRDVKPSNVMLPANGSLDDARVLDFGIARQSLRRDLTQTGMLVGTPGYMSPEQARGSRDVDARADVFALGCLLYKSLTQRAPFAGGSVVAVLAKILLEDPLPVRRIRPDVPEHVERAITMLLAKDPSARPHDGAEAAALLERARRTRDETPAPPPALSLTTLEQRMLSVLLLDIGAAPLAIETADVEATATMPPLANPILACAAAFDVVPEPLADGSILVAFRGAGTEQPARAAKCALAIAREMPGVVAVLGTGRAVVRGGVPVGDLLDRVAALRAKASHRRADGPTIALDGVSATLLEERFTLENCGDLQLLRGEREAGEPVRTLLGKPSPCVGRERELDQLLAMFDECLEEESPRAVLLKAPSGLGKSRVRYELAMRIKGRAQIWTGRGDSMSAGAPFELMTQAIRRAYGIRADDPIELRRQKLAARVARHVPEAERALANEFIGELVGAMVDSGESARVRAARSDPQLMGDQIRAAVKALLRAECAAYPVLLVLEDLHWGDIPTVKLVDALLREAAPFPLFVLASARPEIDDLFPKLWEEHAVLVLPLRELGKRPAAELVHALLPDATDELAADLVARADGNAFYLEELIRAVASGERAALPETVLATVAARLDRLDPAARRVLRAASVFGQAFWRGGVTALAGDDAATDRWLESLAAQEIVQRRVESRFEREPEYVFRHSFVREAAYATLTEADRVTGHKLAGQWLAGAGETNAVALAEHFERGKEPERAALHWLRASEQAMEGNDLALALDLAGRGIRCEPDRASTARFEIMRSEAHRWRGELADARACAMRAMEVAEELGAQWYPAVSQLAYASIAVGDLGPVVAAARKLVATQPKADDLDPFLVALSRLATSLAYGGHTDLAGHVHARMDEALAWGAPTEATLARVRLSTALRAIRMKDDVATLACFGSALEVFERIGDRRGGMYVRLNLGVVQMELGDFERAERAFHEAIAAGIATGVRSIAIGARVNLGLLRAYRGAFDEGLEIVRGARAEYEKLGDQRMMGFARNYEALIALLRGDFPAAERDASVAAEALGPIPTSRADALGIRARALLALRRTQEAFGVASEAFAILTEAGSVDDGDVRVRLAWIEALLASGAHEEGRAVLAATQAKLDERARRLDDPELRAFFLERVPENARVMALARG
ncbi:MAG TPA: protein kinase [Polyangiaceae bacterium]|jgi:tetratricopeptide (TPR) repeat protein